MANSTGWRMLALIKPGIFTKDLMAGGNVSEGG